MIDGDEAVHRYPAYGIDPAQLIPITIVSREHYKLVSNAAHKYPTTLIRIQCNSQSLGRCFLLHCP